MWSSIVIVLVWNLTLSVFPSTRQRFNRSSTRIDRNLDRLLPD